MGRRRRADHPGGGAGGAERLFPGDGKRIRSFPLKITTCRSLDRLKAGLIAGGFATEPGSRRNSQRRGSRALPDAGDRTRCGPAWSWHRRRLRRRELRPRAPRPIRTSRHAGRGRTPTFTACPFSNGVIAGLRDLRSSNSATTSRAAGITVAMRRDRVDPQAQRSRSPTARGSPTTGWCWRPASTPLGRPTRLRRGGRRADAARVEGRRADALLRRQLEAMEDGGTS